MNKIEKEVLQKKCIFVSKDVKEFDTHGACADYEYELAIKDANKFDFKWKDDFEEYFTVVYHTSMKNDFAEDLSIILCFRFGLDETNSDYDHSNILNTFKKVNGCELVDGHEYSFDCFYNGDELDLYITDITERNRVQNAIPECKEAILENQTTRDFIELAKHQVNAFGSSTVKIVLDDIIKTICKEQS